MPSGQGNTSLDPRTTDAAAHCNGRSWIFAVISPVVSLCKAACANW